MGALVLAGVGLAGGACAWLMAPTPETGPAPVATLGTRRDARALAGWLEGLGQTGLVRVAGELDSWRRATRAAMLLEPVRALGIDAAGVRGLIFSLCVAALVLGLVVARSAIGAVAGLGLSLAGIAAWASARERAWAAELSRQVPEAFRSLAGALAAGRTLAQAISYVGATGKGPLQREFARASLRVSCGISPTEALSELAGRTQAPGVALMVTALAVSARTGAPLQGLFMRSARLVERRFELERELAAKTAQVRLSARIVSAMPALMVAVLSLLSPDFREGLATPVGAGCVCVAAVLDAVALLIIRRLMRGVV